jgi:hypothetical protein
LIHEETAAMESYDVELIHRRMKELGLGKADLGVDRKTASRVLRGKPVREGTLKLVAKKLRIEVADLRKRAGFGTSTRSIAGEWEGCGQALALEPHFRNRLEGAAQYTFRMSVEQDEVGNVTATGTMKGFEVTPLNLRGSMHEEGNILVFEYKNGSEKLNDYGSGLLEYDADGRKLSGFFLGRYKALAVPFVLGAIEFWRVER